MSTSCRRLDDVALWSIIKLVDAATLQNCRRVCMKWNREILRLNNYTSKYNPKLITMEIKGTNLELSVGSKSSSKNFEEDPVSSETIRNILRHVSPPETFIIFLNPIATLESYEVMMQGIEVDWLRNIKEVEFVCHNSDMKLSKIMPHLGKCSNLTCLSLSCYCKEQISIGEIFEMFPELRHLRIFVFNSNDGSGCSSGLTFDDNAAEKLLKNQKSQRKIQSIELFNTDITISIEVMTEVLRSLARLPVIQNSAAPQIVNLLFENCQWGSINEFNLLSSIIRISSQYNFPIQQPNESILKGDFKFSIFRTEFVLKFMV